VAACRMPAGTAPRRARPPPAATAQSQRGSRAFMRGQPERKRPSRFVVARRGVGLLVVVAGLDQRYIAGTQVAHDVADPALFDEAAGAAAARCGCAPRPTRRRSPAAPGPSRAVASAPGGSRWRWSRRRRDAQWRRQTLVARVRRRSRGLRRERARPRRTRARHRLRERSGRRRRRQRASQPPSTGSTAPWT